MKPLKRILAVLKKEDDLTTYQVAKKANVSWSTANMHLFKLYAKGQVKFEELESRVGTGLKTIWRIKKKRVVKNEIKR